jgi:hypothetical protein
MRMNSQIGECGVCGRWRSGDALPSGNNRPDGTTPCDNFVCWRCQQEARDLREVNRALNRYALDQYSKRRGRVERGA